MISTKYLPKDTEKFLFLNGIAMVHNDKQCDDKYPCTIHRHSIHTMYKHPMLLRETGLIEHICEHGVGHPCPDSAAYYGRLYKQDDAYMVHGCDGCCFQMEGVTD